MGFFSSIKNLFGKSTPRKPESPAPDAEKAVHPETDSLTENGETFSEPETHATAESSSENNQLFQEAPLAESEDASNTDYSAKPDAGNESEELQKPDAINENASITEEFQPQAKTDIEARAENEAPIQSVEIAETPTVENKINEEDDALLVRLRSAEPRLSVWLDIALENVQVADDLFWKRIAFLLRALEAPENEISSFNADFKNWLEKMEYWHLDEFRSELQYRLALALDLEDEEDERNRLLLKLRDGLAKTRETLGRQLDQIFASHGELNDKFWDELEELLIMSDMGYETSIAMVERLKERSRKCGIKERAAIKDLFFAEMTEIFDVGRKIQAVNKPEVILVSGVNGAGKTTTIGKLANRMRMQGKKTLVVAADTFRAAAIEQLQVWAERAGALFYAKKPGADPASVAWEGLELALRENVDTVFIDTAGRLQTKTNLMEELGKIRQVLAKKHPGSPHRSILVLDATTGQNALSQAKLFRDAAGVDELILTKIDGTAKGGVALAVAMQEKLPISFVGLGEKMEDLRPFNGKDYAHALLGDSLENQPGA